jgi:hypothetical protein
MDTAAAGRQIINLIFLLKEAYTLDVPVGGQGLIIS